VINKQLKELEMYGLIKKIIYPVLLPHSEYALTEVGETLIPIVEQLEEWGNYFQPTMANILGIELEMNKKDIAK
jgi:Predicted transcriptional regulators